MRPRNLTVKITVEYVNCICYDYVKQAKDKARECGFPLGFRVVFPEGPDAMFICNDEPDALSKFECYLDKIATGAREAVASLTDPGEGCPFRPRVGEE